MSHLVEVEDLRLRYRRTTALGGVSFTLRPDRIHGLLGRNGSGKTSLLSILAAFRRPTSGRVRIGGRPVFENPAVTRDVAFIGAHGGVLWEDEKPREALRLARGLRPDWDEGYARTLVDLFEVPLRTPIGKLSRGQRSGLGIVLGLAARAPLTILDETYLGLDAPSRYAFYDALLEDYMAHPRTFVVSTHLIEEVGRILEEVLILDRGRLLVHEETETLLARGLAVTGRADAVDRYLSDHVPLGVARIGERRLGPTKSVMLYGSLDEARRRRAREAALEIEPLALQDLFVHLTDPAKEEAA